MTAVERVINHIRNGRKVAAISYSVATINKALKDQSLTADERQKLEAVKEEIRAVKAQQPPTTAQQVKAALKAAGFDTRKISVTSSYPGYEEVVNVQIKNVFINLEAIEAIAYKFREVAYDERCQEILAGGNTFVRVQYEYNALSEAITALVPFASDIIKQITHIRGREPETTYFKAIAPNDAVIEIFADCAGWTLKAPDPRGAEYVDKKRFIEPGDYTPEYFPRGLAQALFFLGARYVDRIPDPEPPAPDPDDSSDKGSDPEVPTPAAPAPAPAEPARPKAKRRAAPPWVGRQMTAYPKKPKKPDWIGRKMIITIGERSARPAGA